MSINIYPDEVHQSQLGEPAYGPEIDEACEAIHKATKGLGTDEKALIATLGSRPPAERHLISFRYRQKYNQELYHLMKKENSGDFGTLAELLALPIEEAEAKIVRIATKGFGTDKRLLWPVICGRSNEEMEILKKAYFMRYNKDLATLLASELSGDFKKLAMVCLQGIEERYDPTYHNSSKAGDDAEKFYKAGQGRWGTDETALFQIICQSPPNHLQSIQNHYVAKYNQTLQRALEKELSGAVKKAALFQLGMKLEPHVTIADHIKSTCAGMGTDEMGLICDILRYQQILPRIMIEHVNLYSKTIPDRVRQETSGDLRDLLLEMIRVAWPDAHT